MQNMSITLGLGISLGLWLGFVVGLELGYRTSVVLTFSRFRIVYLPASCTGAAAAGMTVE